MAQILFTVLGLYALGAFLSWWAFIQKGVPLDTRQTRGMIVGWPMLVFASAIAALVGELVARKIVSSAFVEERAKRFVHMVNGSQIPAFLYPIDEGIAADVVELVRMMYRVELTATWQQGQCQFVWALTGENDDCISDSIRSYIAGFLRSRDLTWRQAMDLHAKVFDAAGGPSIAPTPTSCPCSECTTVGSNVRDVPPPQTLDDAR